MTLFSAVVANTASCNARSILNFDFFSECLARKDAEFVATQLREVIVISKTSY
jgi:hypothetical protein